MRLEERNMVNRFSPSLQLIESRDTLLHQNIDSIHEAGAARTPHWPRVFTATIISLIVFGTSVSSMSVFCTL